MSSYDKAKALFDEFKQGCEKTPCDLSKCEKLLAQLKVLVLIGTLSSSAQGAEAAKEQQLSRDTLELACFLSIKLKDLSGFERHVAQLKMFYDDANSTLPQSGKRLCIQGMYLMHMLASDRIGEFHTELELCPFDDHQNEYIKHAINLERFLMEGNYTKILEVQKHAPDPSYSFFLERLVETVRMKIGASLERTYDHIPTEVAAKMLILPDVSVLQAFVVKENERKALQESDDTMADMTPSLTRRMPTGLVKWEVKDGMLWFVKSAEKRMQVPALDLMVNTIGYATDLERIV